VSDAVRLQGGGKLQGTMRVPGDKSISHRALIFNAMSRGQATITGLLDAADVRSTATCLASLGVPIRAGCIQGGGGTLQRPTEDLDCGNSGTTMRLLLGALSGQPFKSVLTGDDSLCKRPMLRVTEPLGEMGARFEGAGARPPIVMSGGQTKNISFKSPVASAQVKTAMMLAAIQADGTLFFEEPACSRDHTERMFRSMGVQFEEKFLDSGAHQITMRGPQALQARSLEVPGDISSAAFFMVAASIVPGSNIVIENVGLNPTRNGVISVLQRMGANIEVVSERTVSGEPVADLHVRSAPLRGTTIDGDEIPRLVDELPVLAIAAGQADGETKVRDAQELRVKESDRIESTVAILNGMGVDVQPRIDGFDIQGQASTVGRSFEIRADGDHRIAMAALIGALRCEGVSTVYGASSIQTSYPAFIETLEKLRG
jgi:3-phosphoshikimate 1-carboxyvinyltransferase